MAKILFFFLLAFLFDKSTAPPPPPPINLGDACQKIWNAAGNNLKVPLELKVNTVGVNINPVFTLEPAGRAKVDSSQVFTKFRELLQNNDDAHQDAFLDEIAKPAGPVGQALDYLKRPAIGILPPTETMASFKSILKEMWFKPPAGFPPGTPGKGFKHVFIGERFTDKSGKLVYSGFHNWYQFYLEQSKSPSTVSNAKMDTTKPPGYTYNTEPSYIRLGFNWATATKNSASSLFVGTSPAFDFALYSTCFLALYKGKVVPGRKDCTCKIHKSELQITAIMIKKPPGSGKICTVYPSSINADPVCTSIQPTTRTDCGWLGIDHHNCAERGCCFDSQQYGGHIYWCFYPSDHKCHGIDPKQRVDCGRPGISRNECEGKGCCFDENFGQGVPHCFQGVMKR